MNFFIRTDLEGATGVAEEWSHFSPGGQEHESARRFLTGDVNAAIEGAFEGGAEEIVVLDGHGLLQHSDRGSGSKSPACQRQEDDGTGGA